MNKGDRVFYKPTGEKGVVRFIGSDYAFVVYDHKDELATITSDWAAQRTRLVDLELEYTIVY